MRNTSLLKGHVMSLFQLMFFVGAGLIAGGVITFFVAICLDFDEDFATAVMLAGFVLAMFGGIVSLDEDDNARMASAEKKISVVDAKRNRAIATAKKQCAPYAAATFDVQDHNLIVYACANDNIQHTLGY